MDTDTEEMIGDGQDITTTSEERREMAKLPVAEDRVGCPAVGCVGGEIIKDHGLLFQATNEVCSVCGGSGSVLLNDLPHRPKTLLLGERFNHKASGPHATAHFTSEVDRWYRTSLSIGCFCRGPSKGKLRSIGLSWDASLNLTLPAPQGVAFDMNQARTVAAHLLRETACELLLLCGQKVADAVCGNPKLPLFVATPVKLPFESHVRWIARIPHPSGLNRWWQGDGLTTEARTDMVPRMYEDANGIH